MTPMIKKILIYLNNLITQLIFVQFYNIMLIHISIIYYIS